MPVDDDPGSSVEPRTTQPLFVVPQPDGISVILDFATPGPFGDFAFTARIPETDGPVRERVYGAYHTAEAAIFVEILQHWARVAEPDDILAGLERADAVLRLLTSDLEPTTRSENDFDDLLRRGIEPLAAMDFAPGDHEHSDERGDVIVLAPGVAHLHWISRRDPSTTFAVPPAHLWVFVTGMTWRTYDHDTIPLSRLSTAAYETGIAVFRGVIRSRHETQRQLEGQEEVRLPTAELVQSLCDLLGAKLVAYLSSTQDTRTVRAWADPADLRTPSNEVVARLRIAHQAATLLIEKDSAAVVQTWFQGRNLLLDDVAPARRLRDEYSGTAGRDVLLAARAYAAQP